MLPLILLTLVITTFSAVRFAASINSEAKNGQSHFYASTLVEGVRYFSYYEPLYASDGTCIGMIFLGKPSAEVERLVYRSLSPIIIIGIFTMLLACVVTIRFSGNLVLLRSEKQMR